MSFGWKELSDKNSLVGSFGNPSCTTCGWFAVAAFNNKFVSLFDFVTASYERFGAEFAGGSLLDNTESADKIFDTSVFVIAVSFDTLGSKETSDCSFSILALSDIFVSKYKDCFFGYQFLVCWIWNKNKVD